MMSYEDPEILYDSSEDADAAFNEAVTYWIQKLIWKNAEDRGKKPGEEANHTILWWKIEQEEKYYSSWTFDGYEVRVECETPERKYTFTTSFHDTLMGILEQARRYSLIHETELIKPEVIFGEIT